jgi:hypothetical protein
MIAFYLSVKNPFARDLEKTFSFSKDYKISKHKVFEFQFCRFANYHWFSFRFNLAWRGDSHAGPSLGIKFFGHDLTVRVYDTRHWDYKKGTWENHES